MCVFVAVFCFVDWQLSIGVGCGLHHQIFGVQQGTMECTRQVVVLIVQFCVQMLSVNCSFWGRDSPAEIEPPHQNVCWTVLL